MIILPDVLLDCGRFCHLLISKPSWTNLGRRPEQGMTSKITMTQHPTRLQIDLSWRSCALPRPTKCKFLCVKRVPRKFHLADLFSERFKTSAVCFVPCVLVQFLNYRRNSTRVCQPIVTSVLRLSEMTNWEVPLLIELYFSQKQTILCQLCLFTTWIHIYLRFKLFYMSL